MMNTHLGKSVFCIIALRCVKVRSPLIKLNPWIVNLKTGNILCSSPSASHAAIRCVFWKLPLTQRMLHGSCTTPLVTVIPVCLSQYECKTMNYSDYNNTKIIFNNEAAAAIDYLVVTNNTQKILPNSNVKILFKYKSLFFAVK